MSVDLKKKIMSLVEEIKPYEEINEKTDLLGEGGLDSLSIFAFVTLLEDEFDIEIPDDEITRDNFATIEKVTSLLHSLMKSGEKNDC